MSASHDDEPHEEHEEHVNHEAWVIPYADLLTLLMAMFIALFAMSKVDNDKFKEFALGLNQAFSGHDMNTGVFADPSGSGISPGLGEGQSRADGGNVGPGKNPEGKSVLEQLLSANERTEAIRAAEKQTLGDVKKKIEARAEQLGVGNNLELELQERGLVVRIVTDEVVFGSGDATLRPEGASVIALVAESLREVDNTLLVEGHTDDRPINTVQFPSNWELSTARAGAVVRELIAQGIDPNLLRPTGYADLNPLVPNDSDVNRARNRRVEIVIQSKIVEDALEQAGATDDVVEETPDDTVDVSPRIEPNIDDIVGDLAAGA